MPVIIPELPITLVSKLSRTLRASVRTTRSPSTGYGQVQDWLGEWWAYDLTFGLHTRSEGRRVGAFFNGLRGAATPFLFRDPSLKPEFTATTVAMKVTSEKNASSITTSGWTPNMWVPAGTFFSIIEDAPRLHQVTQSNLADANGDAVLQIAPRLRQRALGGAPLNVGSPAVQLQLIDPVPSVIERAEIYTFTLRAEEWL